MIAAIAKPLSLKKGKRLSTRELKWSKTTQPYKWQRRYCNVKLVIQIATVQIIHVCVFRKERSMIELLTQCIHLHSGDVTNRFLIYCGTVHYGKTA